MRVSRANWTGSSHTARDLVRGESVCFLAWTKRGFLVHALSFLKPNSFWMLTGIAKGNHSQPGHPLPAGKAEELVRRSRSYHGKRRRQRLAENHLSLPNLLVLFRDPRKAEDRAWTERRITWEKGLAGTELDHTSDSTLLQAAPWKPSRALRGKWTPSPITASS